MRVMLMLLDAIIVVYVHQRVLLARMLRGRFTVEHYLYVAT